MIYNRFFFSFLWLFVPLYACSDTVWISRLFRPSDGLAYQIVRDIAQSPDGTVWFATWGGGLSRFNGSQWETLNKEKKLSDFMTRTLVYDRKGGLWVGTTSGIRYFDGQKWTEYSTKTVPALKNDSVYSILPRKNGEIWFGMKNGYLYSYDPYKKYSSKWTPIQTPEYFSNRSIRSLIESEDESVWIGGQNVYHFSEGNWSEHSIGQRTYCLCKTNDGRIFSAASDSLMQYDGESWTIEQEGGKEPRSIVATEDGTLVVGTTMGVRIRQNGVWSDLSLSQELSFPYVEGIRSFEDGSIWIGTRNGVYFVRPSDWSAFPSPTDQYPITGDRIIPSKQQFPSSISQQGEIFRVSNEEWTHVGTLQGAGQRIIKVLSQDDEFLVVHRSDGILKYRKSDRSIVQSIPIQNKKTMVRTYQSSDGTYWMHGTEGEGLEYWTGTEWKLYERKNNKNNERVHFFKETKDGTKWIVYNDEIEPIGKEYSFLDFFKDLRFRGHRITDICVTKSGEIWFASSGEGIIVFDGKKKTKTKHTAQNGLPSDWILCLYEDSDGTIWAGMEDSTVASFRENRWVSYSKEEIQLEGHVTQIMDDAERGMWFVVEPTGLMRYVPSRNQPETIIDVYPDVVVPKGMAIFSFHGWDAWHVTPSHELVFSWRILKKQDNREILSWTPFQSNETINSPPLYPGEYIFEVRSADKERNIDPTPASVHFTVEPYFFMKSVFWIPVLFFMLFALVSLLTLYRKHLELRESEKWLSQAQQIARIGHWIADFMRDRLMGSDEAFRILGIESNEFKGSFKSFLRFVHPKDRRGLLKTIREALLNCHPFRIDCHIVRTDGISRIVQIQAEIDADVSNVPIRLMGTIQDISEKRRLEDNSRRVQKLEAVSVLAGGIAHDFNNLLTAIFGNLSLIKRSVDVNDKIYKRLLESEKAMQRAHDLTRQLIAFSSNSEPDRSICPISEFLKDTAQSALDRPNVSLLFDFSNDLHDAIIDKNQFNQMIRNIVTNAAQAMPNGGTIYISATNLSIKSQVNEALPKGDYVKISIKDQGDGIPLEHLPKIFDPYFTTQDNVTQKGLGLGLAICYSIAKQHHGYIEVESEIGVGSTFHIYLPAS